MMMTMMTMIAKEKKRARAGLRAVRGVAFLFKIQIGPVCPEVTLSETFYAAQPKLAHHLVHSHRGLEVFSLVADTPLVVTKLNLPLFPIPTHPRRILYQK
jgi:hypothetical protein